MSLYHPSFITTNSSNRFGSVEAAERCIIALRRYRNLHPTFSKVRLFFWISDSLLIDITSKSTKSPAPYTLSRRQVHMKILTPRRLALIASGMLRARTPMKATRRSRLRWKRWLILRAQICIWKACPCRWMNRCVFSPYLAMRCQTFCRFLDSFRPRFSSPRCEQPLLPDKVE